MPCCGFDNRMQPAGSDNSANRRSRRDCYRPTFHARGRSVRSDPVSRESPMRTRRTSSEPWPSDARGRRQQHRPRRFRASCIGRCAGPQVEGTFQRTRKNSVTTFWPGANSDIERGSRAMEGVTPRRPEPVFCPPISCDLTCLSCLVLPSRGRSGSPWFCGRKKGKPLTLRILRFALPSATIDTVAH